MEILVSAMAVLVALSCLVALIYTELLSKDDDEREIPTSDGAGFDEPSPSNR